MIPAAVAGDVAREPPPRAGEQQQGGLGVQVFGESGSRGIDH